MPIQRLTVRADNEGDIWEESHRDGQYVYWKDVADFVVKVSGLIDRIELQNDLHAVFTIKDSDEFAKVKAAVSEIFKE